MSRVQLAVLAAVLLGLALPACSLSQPAPKDFVLVDKHAAENAPPASSSPPGNWGKIGKETGAPEKGVSEKGAGRGAANSLQAAELACKAETERKGIGSLVGIFSRLRKGSADEDYVACMKARGYEVKP
jgi:hypothetical protein